ITLSTAYMIPSPPRSPLFPYTTLFRSVAVRRRVLREQGVRLAALLQHDVGAGETAVRRLDHDFECAGLPDELSGLADVDRGTLRSEEHTSELQSRENLVCRLLLEKNKI